MVPSRRGRPGQDDTSRLVGFDLHFVACNEAGSSQDRDGDSRLIFAADAGDGYRVAVIS